MIYSNKFNKYLLVFSLLIAGCNSTPDLRNYSGSTNQTTTLFKNNELPSDKFSTFYRVKIPTWKDSDLNDEYFTLMYKQNTNKLYILTLEKGASRTLDPKLTGLNIKSWVGFPPLDNKQLTQLALEDFSKRASDDHGDLTGRLIRYMEEKGVKSLGFDDVISFLEKSENIYTAKCNELTLLCKNATEYLPTAMYHETTVEIIDYRETLLQHNKSMKSRRFNDALTLKIPTQFIDKNIYISAINNSSSLADIQIISTVVNANRLTSVKGYLDHKRDELTFLADFNVAKKASYDAQKRFVTQYQALFTDSKPCYRINASSLNIRKSPSPSATKTGSYTLDDLVCSTNVKKKWVQTKKGWVYKKYLSEVGFENGKENFASIAKIVDQKEYKKALKDNTIAAHNHYLTLQPKGRYVLKIIDAMKRLYLTQNNFDGFMEAYKLSADTQLLKQAYDVVINSPQQVHVSESLLGLYIDKAVTSISHIVDLNTLITNTQIDSIDRFSDKLVELSDFGRNLSINTFFDSVEYQYLLKNLKHKTWYRNSETKYFIDAYFDETRIIFEFSGKCEFLREKSVTRETGFLDSLLTLGADEQTTYYKEYSCIANTSDVNNIKQFSQHLNDNTAYSALTKKLYWEYSKHSAGDNN